MEDENIIGDEAMHQIYLYAYKWLSGIVLVFFMWQQGGFDWLTKIWNETPGDLVGTGVLIIGGILGLQQWKSDSDLKNISSNYQIFEKESSAMDQAISRSVKLVSMLTNQVSSMPKHPNKSKAMRELAGYLTNEMPNLNMQMHGLLDHSIFATFWLSEREMQLQKSFVLRTSNMMEEAKDYLRKYASEIDYLTDEQLLRALEEVLLPRLNRALKVHSGHHILFSSRFHSYQTYRRKWWMLGDMFEWFNVIFWDKNIYRENSEELFNDMEELVEEMKPNK